MSDRLFEPSETETRVDKARAARAEFLAGMLATWALGESKPSKEERAQLVDIATTAIFYADNIALARGAQ